MEAVSGKGARLSSQRASCFVSLSPLPARFALSRGLHHQGLEEEAEDKKSEGSCPPGRHNHEMG